MTDVNFFGIIITKYNIQVILLTLLCALIIYTIVVLRNFNKSAKIIAKLLDKNKDELDHTIKQLPEIADNTTEITRTAKEEIAKVRKVISGINETTAAATHILRNELADKLKTIIEVVFHIYKMISREKDKKEDNK